ncbi:MAG: hypothetical protein E7429_03970 [Ruminococcaceae bacterium]|nr:hypothetical protein [Oscillospiraceae bacterium]
MKKNRWMLRMAVLLLISAVMTLTVSVAAAPGTNEDPLVTLSYLSQNFMNELLGRVDEKIAQRNDQVVQKLSEKSELEGTILSNGTFAVVRLNQGQTLTGDMGCEVLLRGGDVTCVADSYPGLVDQTTSEVLGNGGALVVNHLYMMTVAGRAVTSAADNAVLLVRGTYTIE